jgi:hypothetical protein
LFIELRRLADPQQLNLYSYARNNPLRFKDPTGMVVQMNCESEKDCLSAEKMINGRDKHQFQVKAEGGWLAIVSGSVTGQLSAAEQALYDAITDPNNIAVVNVVEDTKKAEFGVFDSNGANTIDLGNLSKLDAPGNKGGIGSGDVASHELLEAYGNLFTKDAHNQVAKLFPGLGGPQNRKFVKDQSGNNLLGISFAQAISDGRGTMETNVTFITPIPSQSLAGKTLVQKVQAIENAPARIDSVKFIP